MAWRSGRDSNPRPQLGHVVAEPCDTMRTQEQGAGSAAAPKHGFVILSLHLKGVRQRWYRARDSNLRRGSVGLWAPPLRGVGTYNRRQERQFSRPTEASKAAVCYVRGTSTLAVRAKKHADSTEGDKRTIRF
jgi:hypothetical protein